MAPRTQLALAVVCARAAADPALFERRARRAVDTVDAAMELVDTLTQIIWRLLEAIDPDGVPREAIARVLLEGPN